MLIAGPDRPACSLPTAKTIIFADHSNSDHLYYPLVDKVELKGNSLETLKSSQVPDIPPPLTHLK